MDKGRIWKFKVFFLFPVLNRLHTLDHVFRVLYPIAYLIFVLVELDRVGFGLDQRERLQSSSCYSSIRALD